MRLTCDLLVTCMYSSSGLDSASSPNLAALRLSRAEPDSLACASLPHVLSSSPPGHYMEHEETTLHLYGGGALEAMETITLHGKQPIQHVSFNYLEFDDIAQWLPKLVTICPNVTVSLATRRSSSLVPRPFSSIVVWECQGKATL